MKLLVDMNLSPRWATFLNEAGWETVHWSAVGRFDAADAEVMAYAAGNDYVILTHDLDFSAILAVTHGKKPSVVQVRTDDVSVQVLGPRIIVTLRHLTTELQAGALLTIGPAHTRMRMLPIKSETSL